MLYISALLLWYVALAYRVADCSISLTDGRLRSVLSLAAIVWASTAPFVALAIYVTSLCLEGHP